MFIIESANLSGLTHFTEAEIVTASARYVTRKQAYAAARFLSTRIGRSFTVAFVDDSYYDPTYVSEVEGHLV